MAVHFYTLGIAITLVSLACLIPALYFVFRSHHQLNLQDPKKPWYRSALILLPLSMLELDMAILVLGSIGAKWLPGLPVFYVLEILLPLIGIVLLIYTFLLLRKKSL